MKFFGYISIVIFLKFISTFCKAYSGGGLLNTPSYYEMEACLLVSGIKSSNIVWRSGSSEYRNLNYQWQLRVPYIRPKAFILVENERQVKYTVKCARKSNVRVVGKSGGHSFGKYSFGDSNTVIIDLQKIKSVSYQKCSNTVTVGPGALIGPLIHTLWKNWKILIPTTNCPTLGISGVSTGGGYGRFIRKYGLVEDSILEMRMVTAEGEILTVNNHTNSDLYFALRGGGAGSFGIVTKIKFAAQDLPSKVLFANLNYDLNYFAQLVNSWQNYVASNPPKDVFTEIFIGDNMITVSFQDLTGDTLRFNSFKGLFPPPQNSTENLLTYPEFLVVTYKYLSEEPFTKNVKLNKYSDIRKLKRKSQAKNYLNRRSFFVKNLLDPENLSKLASLINEAPPGTGLYYAGWGGAINDIGIHDTAFAHRGDTLYLLVFEYFFVGRDTEQERKGMIWLDNFFKLGNVIFKHPGSYLNYIDPDLPNYLTRYYGSNLQRLVKIKRKYDPENYFYNDQSIPTLCAKSSDAPSLLKSSSLKSSDAPCTSL